MAAVTRGDNGKSSAYFWFRWQQVRVRKGGAIYMFIVEYLFVFNFI